uniref:DOMON domain-containing protein n=1 Tax=Arion vulgaris TaxID=1028688 RepID=A0A0B7AT02_9EUPU
MQSLTVAFACLAVCLGLTFTDAHLWDGLKMRWDVNPFNMFFAKPTTEEDAVKENYVKISDCDVNAPWRGARYIKGNDRSVTLLFDVNGHIAGIQAGIPKNQSDGYPTQSIRPPFISDGDNWVVTIYVTDPAKICTTGRSDAEVSAQGTGTNLYIQNSTIPEDSIKAPFNEADIAGTKWTEGKCFIGMGKHYWFNLSLDMKQENMFPVFLLYTGGKSIGFGWAMPTNLTSSTYEHPPSNIFSLFMKEVPIFLTKVSVVSTMHVFMTNSPSTIFCPLF